MPATYDHIGRGYVSQRTTDPRIAKAINAALGGSNSVLNVGAGTGSYEPIDRRVVALEPSRVMIRQRAAERAPAVQGVAERLPFANKSFDAVLGVLTLHHWTDQQRGFAECARVARERIVFLTWDPECENFWLVRDYFPSLITQDRSRFPSIGSLVASFPSAKVQTMPIPGDCIDGFLGAFWRRPEAYLDASVRNGISAFANCADLDDGLHRLQADVNSRHWYLRNQEILQCDALDLGYRLVTARV